MDSPSLTALIHRMQDGDREAAESVFHYAAQRLREISSILLFHDPGRSQLRPSDLVNEAYIHKIRSLPHEPKLKDRWHFFALAKRGMHQLLIDQGRARGRGKRREVRLDTVVPENNRELLLDLQGALERLRSLDALTATVLRLRHEAGFTLEETSQHTGLTLHQVRMREKFALRWVRNQMERSSRE